jgi:hypothetical protein
LSHHSTIALQYHLLVSRDKLFGTIFREFHPSIPSLRVMNEWDRNESIHSP